VFLSSQCILVMRQVDAGRGSKRHPNIVGFILLSSAAENLEVRDLVSHFKTTSELGIRV
jgi:hypothetical protein